MSTKHCPSCTCDEPEGIAIDRIMGRLVHVEQYLERLNRLRETDVLSVAEAFAELERRIAKENTP